jgi:flagellar basal-body rod modification protein FlgD
MRWEAEGLPSTAGHRGRRQQMSSAIEMIGASAGSTATVAGAAVQQAQLGTDTFLRLLVTQLQNQDPLDPLSNENFLAQLAQFQSLQEQIETAENTRGLLLAQSLGAASALVGKQISAEHEGYLIIGSVDKVVVAEGEVKLVVGGMEIDLSEVTEVREEVV